MLLDSESLDLVQHIDTVLAAVEGSDLEHELHPELMQSVLEIATPVCRDIGEVTTELHRLRAAVTDVARRDRAARRLGGHAPVQPVRAAAHHRPRPLPRARRPAPVRRPARADLRHAHPRRDRRPGEGGRRAQRHARPPAAAARAQRVALRSGAASRPASPPRGSSSSPRSRAPALPRASGTTPTTRASSASSSARAASPTTRTSGGTSGRTRGWARSRCASATR